MKFVKGISLFFVLPILILALGIWIGVEVTHFFYPGEQKSNMVQEAPIRSPFYEQEDDSVQDMENLTEGFKAGTEVTTEEKDTDIVTENLTEVSSNMETLSVDTEYVLEETDIVTGSVVETVWKLPDKYIGLNREQFLDAMESYEMFPPLAEMERGFVDLEVLSFSRERVVVQMNYQYLQPSTSFYLAVRNNEVVVYLEDMETIYINTGIQLDSLPEDTQMEIMQMIWVEDEESLYNFLEAYSS